MVRRMRLQPSIQATSSLRSMYSGTVLDQLTHCQPCRSCSEKSRGRQKVKLPVILQEFLWTENCERLLQLLYVQHNHGVVFIWRQSMSWSRYKIWQDWGQSHSSRLFRRATPRRWKHGKICTNTVGLSRTWNHARGPPFRKSPKKMIYFTPSLP